MHKTKNSKTKNLKKNIVKFKFENDETNKMSATLNELATLDVTAMEHECECDLHFKLIGINIYNIHSYARTCELNTYKQLIIYNICIWYVHM